MDPVTLIGMVAVVGMFCTGVALVWTGLRRRPDRLPEGAEAVLAAVAEGRIAKPEHVIDLVRPPAQPPRRADLPPSVRLLPREGAAQGAESETSAVPATSTSRTAVLAPESRPKAAPTPPAERPADTTSAAAEPAPAGDVTEAVFDGVDDPKGDDFFASKPELQRF